MLAISLPAGMFLGTVVRRPVFPFFARESMFGLCAAIIGVIPLGQVAGSSAMPSPKIIMYFIFLSPFVVLFYFFGFSFLKCSSSSVSSCSTVGKLVFSLSGIEVFVQQVAALFQNQTHLCVRCAL